MIQNSSTIFVPVVAAQRERDLAESRLARLARAAMACCEVTQSRFRRLVRYVTRQPAARG